MPTYDDTPEGTTIDDSDRIVLSQGALHLGISKRFTVGELAAQFLAGTIGFTPINKAGDSGIGSLSLTGSLTLAGAPMQLTQGGDTWADGLLFARAGAATAPMWLVASDNTFNIGRANADHRYISLGSTGNVGIGIAAPAATRLQIQNLSSLQCGLFVNQTSPAGVGGAGPIFLNNMSGNFSGEVTGTGASAGVSCFHAALGIGGPDLVGNEFYGASFGCVQTAADTATGDRVGVAAGAVGKFSTTGKYYGASFSTSIESGASTEQAVGVEVDSFIDAGSTTNNRIGFNAWNGGTGTAVVFDSAFAASCSGAGSAAAGSWKRLISLYTKGGVLQHALSTDADWFYSDTTATVANFANLSNLTVTGNILSFPSVTMTGSGLLGMGTSTAPTARVDVGGTALSVPSWTTSGAALRVRASNYTDTTGSGTIATRVGSSFGAPTFGATSAVTLTDAINLYVAGPPNAGANTTISNSAAFVVAAGRSGFGSLAPTATVQIAQGGDAYSDGFLISRAGASVGTMWLDSADNTFNLGRTASSSTKYFSMSSAGLVTLSQGLAMSARVNAVDDAAAATAGVAVGSVYRNGSVLMQRIT